jgi:DNA-binding MarR family transcriptional regulator
VISRKFLLGDALAQGLIVRHRDNAQFRTIMSRLTPGAEQLAAVDECTRGALSQ